MKKLTFTIVVPVYNEQECIRNCLDAIAAQTDRPDEVIVVDNNSTDDTVPIAQSYDFVTVIREKQQGIVFARNAGFNTAKGDIIGRIDADSIIDRDWVARVKRTFMEQPEIDAITGDCYFYDFPLPRLTKALHHFIYYSLQRVILGANPLWGSNMAIRRQAWRDVRALCCEDKNEDIDLSIHLAEDGKKIRRNVRMIAQVSLRRGNIAPLELFNYLKPWPLTYWHNGLYFGALAICVTLVVLAVIALPVFLIVNAAQNLRLQIFGQIPAEDDTH